MSRAAWGAPSFNPPSRFLEEIPGELVAWQREDPGRPGPAGGSGATGGSGAPASRGSRSGAWAPGRSGTPKPVVSLEPGDRVSHDTFGLGTVVAARGAGERAEADIDFGSNGVKRLLLRYAPVDKL